jgi:hypothetical protein
MKSMLAIVLVAAAAFCIVNAAPAKEDRFKVKVYKGQACKAGSERIRFPSTDKASIKEDPERGEGCFIIQGTVEVKKPISTAQLYVQLRLGAKSEPEKCQKADSNQCGGVGSCIYCATCADAESIEKKSSGLVQIETTDGKSLSCQSELKPGNYSNIRIRACGPTKNDVKKMGNIDDETLERATEGGEKMFFVNLYLFDTKVNTYSYSEVEKMAAKASEPNSHVISCYKMAGALYN